MQRPAIHVQGIEKALGKPTRRTEIGIFVGVNERFIGNTTVRVAVDQVTITGVPGQADRTFTASAEGLAINQYNVPPGTPAPVFHP